MQFTCESCKTILQIADEKVRGKRLVVRCRRCGAKIGISDPALAGSSPPRLMSTVPPASAPPPLPAAKPAAPAPAAKIPEPRGAQRAKDPESIQPTDTESTRAMDSDLLERALQASKEDEPLQARAVPAGAPKAKPPPPRAAAPVSAPRDPPEWFAMIAGKQTGPMTRAEVEGKVNDAAIGPRTYLWKEGMASWQRAKDVPELLGLFGPAPEPAQAPAPLPEVKGPIPALKEFSPDDFAASERAGIQRRPERELSAADFNEVARPRQEPAPAYEPKPATAQPAAAIPQNELLISPGSAAENVPLAEQSAFDLARWATDELTRKGHSNPKISKPDSYPAPSRARTDPILLSQSERKPGTHLWIAAGLGLLIAAAFAAYSTLFGSGGDPGAPKSAATAEARPPPEPPRAEPRAKEPPTQLGLTADQVRRKLDENKSALQSCIDDALKREPNLKVGKIHIATTIAPTGSVTSTRIDKRTVDESALGTCLKRVTRRIAFPTFQGDPFDVDIPIVVTAGE